MENEFKLVKDVDISGKRKVDEEPVSNPKKMKSEVKGGSFIEDQVPYGVFPLGDSLFLTVSTFQGHTTVQIRRYRQFGNKFYPSKEGVTLQPWWINSIFGREEVPQAKSDLFYGITVPENQFQVLSSDFVDFTFIRHKESQNGFLFSKSLDITKDQWKQAIDQYTNISTVVADEYYRSMDFLIAYTSVYDAPLTDNLPGSLDISLGENYLKDAVFQALCETLKSTGNLQDPETRAEELLCHAVSTFNSAALCLDVQVIAPYFYERLWEEQPYLTLRPQMYLTQSFLKNICLKETLQKARHYFCPEKPSEYFEDIM